jgi:hypothetical protein
MQRIIISASPSRSPTKGDTASIQLIGRISGSSTLTVSPPHPAPLTPLSLSLSPSSSHSLHQHASSHHHFLPTQVPAERFTKNVVAHCTNRDEPNHSIAFVPQASGILRVTTMGPHASDPIHTRHTTAPVTGCPVAAAVGHATTSSNQHGQQRLKPLHHFLPDHPRAGLCSASPQWFQSQRWSLQRHPFAPEYLLKTPKHHQRLLLFR